MTIGLDLPKQILEAQIEALKPENLENENVGVLDMCKGQGRTSKATETVSTTSNTEWKWDNITMDFITKLPKSSQDLSMSTAYHPETDGQSERTIQTLEDMLSAQDRQKCYADLKRNPMKFEVGDRVMLKVSPWKGVARFSKRGKLNPRYVGPFKVLAKVGKVSYRMELPQELSRFVEEPVEIMEWEIKRLKRSRIPLVEVRWNSRRGPEFTWECEDSFKQKYPQLFTNWASSSTTRS
ncbi:putative reverse transcriptase domain-containing protein [Tanacetum coccineum]